MDLRTLSGAQLAVLIRERRITSREAVEAHIEQIERANRVINAVVAERFDAARTEADEADRVVREHSGDEPLPPFHGVPCTIKEAFAVRGMPNTSGLVRRRNVVADHDATVVQRLRAAGAIPLGVTNISELCMWMESTNRVYGRTSNPYDPARIPGGSSGGEAAIVAAGGAPFGIGSDIGGSIRGPAFFNGVFGHKPTGGLVPSTGLHPPTDPRAAKIQSVGPIARRAEDLWPLLRAIAGPDGEDPGCDRVLSADPSIVRIEDLTVLDVPDIGSALPTHDVRSAQERAAAALAKSGAHVRVVRFERLRRAFDIWSAVITEAQDTPFATLLGEGTPISAWRELMKWSVGRSDHTIMALMLALGESMPLRSREQIRRSVEIGRALREELVDAIGPSGVMLFPSYARTAPPHDQPIRETLGMGFPFAYLGVINALELPSTQVPLGFDAGGLPLGCQVIGIHGNDHVTIAVAMELERALGGWTPPPRWFGGAREVDRQSR